MFKTRNEYLKQEATSWKVNGLSLIPPDSKEDLSVYDAYTNPPIEHEITRDVYNAYKMARNKILLKVREMVIQGKVLRPVLNTPEQVREDRRSFFCGASSSTIRIQLESILMSWRIFTLYEKNQLFPEVWGFKISQKRVISITEFAGECVICDVKHPFDSHFSRDTGYPCYEKDGQIVSLRDVVHFLVQRMSDVLKSLS